MTVALIGERNLDNVNHLPTELAFEDLSVETEWVETSQIELDDSVLDRYAEFCDAVYEVRNLRQLKAFVEALE